MSTAKSSISERPGSSVLSLSAIGPFALYALALAAVCTLFPYRPALDDNEWMYLAHSVAENGTLAGDSVFMRVPLWQLMLGSVVGWAGDRAGILGLQILAVAAAFALFAVGVRREPGEARGVQSASVVAFLFALSPQLVLYSRHAGTELWVGAFAMAVVVLGERAGKFDARRALLLGACIGAATMTKFSAVALVVAGVVYAWNARERFAFGRSLGAMATGFVAVAGPLVALVAVQRGFPLDDTSAFNLGPLGIEAWEAAAGSAERSALSMQGFWELLGGDPFGYLSYIGAAGLRAIDWFAWPSSLDLRLWIPEYPGVLVELLDHGVFFAVITLAAAGTTRRTWPAWILPLVFWAACSFGQKTPHSPKVALLFPLVLLAPAGLDVLRRRTK